MQHAMLGEDVLGCSVHAQVAATCVLFVSSIWVRVLRTVQTGLRCWRCRRGLGAGGAWQCLGRARLRAMTGRYLCVCVRTHVFVQVLIWECLKSASHGVQCNIADTCKQHCAVCRVA